MSDKKPPPIQLFRKPTYKTIATDCDLLDLFRKVEKQFEDCFIFESLGEESHISRYSILGFDPEKIYYADGKELIVKDRSGHEERYPGGDDLFLLR